MFGQVCLAAGEPHLVRAWGSKRHYMVVRFNVPNTLAVSRLCLCYEIWFLGNMIAAKRDQEESLSHKHDRGITALSPPSDEVFGRQQHAVLSMWSTCLCHTLQSFVSCVEAFCKYRRELAVVRIRGSILLQRPNLNPVDDKHFVGVQN